MLQSGDTLAGYRIEGVAGVGGMGVVYRATQMSLDRPVALKVLSSTLESNQSFRERFRREGRHAAALDHPNIIPVYEAGESDGLMFIAMRLVDGPTLADVILSNSMQGHEAVRVVAAIASALDAAHEAGLVHRDIKPQNILLTRTGHPYLADFGITKGTDHAALTHSGDFVGSLNYVAPEQIDGSGVTGASDVYSLTAVLFHCLSGLPPYERDTDAALMHAHLMAPPPTLAEHGIVAPPQLDEVFLRGMAKEPAARYETATELVDACRAALAHADPAVLDAIPAFPVAGAAAAPPPPPSSPPSASLPPASRPPASPPHASPPPTSPPASPPPRRRPPRRPPAPRSPSRARRRSPSPPSSCSPAPRSRASCSAATNRRSDPASVRAGTVSLEHDGSWSATSARIAGLDLAQPIALRHRDGVTLNAGRLESYPAGFQPIPRALRARFAGRTSQATIRLGARPARRYAVTLRTDGRLWLALAPDSEGWVAIACEGPGADRPAACPAVASSLEVRGARAVAVGPLEQVAKAISAAITDLNRARTAARPRLRVRSAATRADAANQLTVAHERAATALETLDLRPQERPLVTGLARELRGQSRNFERLGSAAVRRQFGRFDRTRRAVTLQERRVRAAVRRLATIGYDAS